MRLRARHPPIEFWKPRIVPIVGDPDATVLNCKRCEPCLGNTGPANIRPETNAHEDRPMPRSWAHDLTMRLFEQTIAKSESLADGTWLPEDARIGCNARHRAQRQRRNPKLGVPQNDPVEPRLADRMAARIGSKRVDQHVDVRKGHWSSSGRVQIFQLLQRRRVVEIDSRRQAAPRRAHRREDALPSSGRPELTEDLAQTVLDESGERTSLRQSFSLARLTRSSGNRTVVLWPYVMTYIPWRLYVTSYSIA